VKESRRANGSRSSARVLRGAFATIGLSILAACSGHPQLVSEPVNRQAETEVVYTSGGGIETTLIPITFVGRFVFEGADGALKPVGDVHVKRQDRAHWKPTQVDLSVDAEGHFSTTVNLLHCQYYESKGKLSGDWVTPATFIIDARGCEQEIIEVSETWESRPILLRCPER